MSEPRSNERSFFSPGTRIEGELEIQGEVTLQGEIRGKVVGTGLVTIGEQAAVEADVFAPAVVVEGTLRGEIRAGERLELRRTARVRGSIRAPRLRIEEGALFEGECRMSPPEAERSEGLFSAEKRPAGPDAAPTTRASATNAAQR